MKKFLILLCFILAVPCCAYGDSFYILGEWYDDKEIISISGLSVQNSGGFVYYKAVDMQCNEKICEMKSSVLSNIGINNKKIWNIYPQYQTYEIISFDKKFVIAKNGAGTLLKISRKTKDIDWIFYDKTYKIITNQQEINKYLLSK